MTKNEKVNKLGHAIKEYRGRYSIQTKKWVQSPNPQAQKRIAKWLTELNLDVATSMIVINGFKSFSSYREWIKAL